MALPRKRRPRRAPRGWSEGLEDLHDYMRAPRQRAAPRARIVKDSGPIVVTDDWPERVPIGDAEFRAIEAIYARNWTT